MMRFSPRTFCYACRGSRQLVKTIPNRRSCCTAANRWHQAYRKDMSNEQRMFLSLPRYPGLISLVEACWLLGLVEHQGKILVARGALVPAGKKRPLVTKLFVSSYVLELAANRDWLNKARDILALHWKEKNSKKPGRSGQILQSTHTLAN